MGRPPVFLITYLGSLFLINDIITAEADWSYRSCLELNGHFERDHSLGMLLVIGLMWLWVRSLCQELLRVLWQEQLAMGVAREILARDRREFHRTAWSKLARKKLVRMKLVRKSLTLKSLTLRMLTLRMLALEMLALEMLTLEMLALGWKGHDISWLVIRQMEQNVLLPCMTGWKYQISRRAYEPDRQSGHPYDSTDLRVHLHLHTIDLLFSPGLVVPFAVRKHIFDSWSDMSLPVFLVKFVLDLWDAQSGPVAVG